MQEKFLNSHGLDLIGKWLEKMPDGSPPGQTLKRKLIEIVSTLPVDGEHVSNTTLSKKLYEFYKNPSKIITGFLILIKCGCIEEDIDLKKTLKIIIDKFSRVALSMSVDYSNQNEVLVIVENTAYAKLFVIRTQARLERVKLAIIWTKLSVKRR